MACRPRRAWPPASTGGKGELPTRHPPPPPRRSHLGAQPSGDGAAAGADLEAAPPRPHPECLEPAGRRRVVDPFERPEPGLGVLPGVVQRVGTGGRNRHPVASFVDGMPPLSSRALAPF